jgi:hypothetical protein
MPADDLNVVAEGWADALLLSRVLPRTLGVEPAFYAAGDGLTPWTLARNILMHEGGPVLVVMDANTFYPSAVEEERALTKATLRLLAADSEFEVFAFAPQMDVAFFEAPSILRRHLGWEGVGAELELGLLDSARRLRMLLEQRGLDREQFYRGLSGEDVDKLLRGPQMVRFTEAAEALFSSYGGLHVR